MRWFGQSLKHKLSVLLLISIFLPLLLFGFFSYSIASDLTEEKTKQSEMNALRQMSTNLDFMIKDIENTAIQLIGHDDIQEYLQSEKPNVTLQTSVISTLIDLSSLKPYIFNISIVPDQPGMRTISAVPIVQSELDTESIPDGHFQQHTKWWSNVHEVKTTSGTHRVVTMIHPVRSIGKYDRIGEVQISLPEEEIAVTLHETTAIHREDILLVDQNDQVLTALNKSYINRSLQDVYPQMTGLDREEGTLDYWRDSDRFSVMYYTVPRVNWKIVSVIPYEQYTSENRYVLQLTAAAAAFSIVLISGMILIVIQWITKPLQALTTFLKQADPEKPLPPYRVTSRDEVGMLVNSYNRLRKRIGILSEQVKYKEELKIQANMRTLQAQINPHFLYNTLSSIRWMALMKKEQEIADMVGSLGDFLQFSLNKGREFCSVEQEVAHAKHYGNIQSIRFPNKFTIEFSIAQEMLNKTMLKLLLQPLIENALIHGIQKKEGTGRVRVGGYLAGDHMVFTIEDDGVGFRKEKLEELLEILDKPVDSDDHAIGSYGIRNVHQRLTLYYGASAGLKISSKEGQGTKVQFAIPITVQ